MADIWAGEFLVVKDYSVHCKMVSSISGLCPLDANSVALLLWQLKIVQCAWDESGEVTKVENTALGWSQRLHEQHPLSGWSEEVLTGDAEGRLLEIWNAKFATLGNTKNVHHWGSKY